MIFFYLIVNEKVVVFNFMLTQGNFDEKGTLKEVAKSFSRNSNSLFFGFDFIEYTMFSLIYFGILRNQKLIDCMCTCIVIQFLIA